VNDALQQSANQAISVRGLSKSFAGKPIVRQLDLDINKGQIFAFLGPNGSGKTTTMRLIAGLYDADAGEGSCLGLNLRDQQHEIRNQIGYVTQHFSLYEDLTVRENLIFTARVFDVPNINDAVSHMIKRFSLAPYTNQIAGSLSGGWKQRLSLACALIHQPQLLMLDEPTSGVDPEARAFFWDTIQAEAAKGVTIMISTHYLDEVQQYANRLAYILQGSLLIAGTTEEVIKASGLFALRIAGGSHDLLADARSNPAVLYAALTNDGVLLSGENKSELTQVAQTIAPQSNHDFVPARLEEVFLHLSKASRL